MNTLDDKRIYISYGVVNIVSFSCLHSILEKNYVVCKTLSAELTKQHPNQNKNLRKSKARNIFEKQSRSR